MLVVEEDWLVGLAISNWRTSRAFSAYNQLLDFPLVHVVPSESGDPRYVQHALAYPLTKSVLPTDNWLEASQHRAVLDVLQIRNGNCNLHLEIHHWPCFLFLQVKNFLFVRFCR